MYRCTLLLVLAVLAFAGPAQAADPIMPLSEVQPGMSCTGLSVVRGTTISSFDVEILDVIAFNSSARGAYLLVRVSGPAVDATGVGPGFSGSPIYCNGRNAGAISQGLGDYENKVVLATPIEAILGARPSTPTSARRDPALLRAARPLAAPLTVSGAGPHALSLLRRAAERSGRPLLDAPPGPLRGYPVQQLVPGAAVGTSFTTGDLGIGAVGTVAYRDGNQVFAFGHPLDGAGRRSLFLQDAYVFGVIDSPSAPDLGSGSYKLAFPGHNVGALTNDTFSAVAGTLGADPPSIPLRASARLRGTSEQVTLSSLVADERALELPGGLSLAAPVAAATALDRVLDSFEPLAITACARFRVQELSRPIGFCNSYFDPFGALTDIERAAGMVDSFDLAPLHIRGAAVSLSAKRGFADDVLIDASGPGRVRSGSTARVRVRVRRRGAGSTRTLTVRVPIPAGLRPGPRTLLLEGGSAEFDEEDLVETLVSELIGREEGDQQAEPRTPRQLARAVARLRRPQGITARFRHHKPRVVRSSNDVLYEGRVKVRLTVVRARR